MLTTALIFIAIPAVILVTACLSPLPNELLPVVYDPGAASHFVFDYHITKYDQKLMKQVALFMNMEYYFAKGGTLAHPAHIFITGNIDYPALTLDRFNFRDYLGDYDVYSRASFCTRGNFSDQPYRYWYSFFDKRVFYPCWYKKIEATYETYLTYESNPELFLAVKEWYMSWGPGADNELRQLFARLIVPFGQDLNNPDCFIDGSFQYTYTGPSQRINWSVEGHKYPTYHIWEYGNVNLLYAWPTKPEDHRLFLDFVRLSAKGLVEYPYPETQAQLSSLKHTMETFLNIYYKNLASRGASRFLGANLVSIDSKGVRNPWGSSRPDFLTLEDLGIIKDICWV